jgi:hypothetical protein
MVDTRNDQLQDVNREEIQGSDGSDHDHSQRFE